MAHANSRNKFDKKDSLALGEHAEKRFVMIAKQLGWQVTPASKDENMNEHWDFLVEKEDYAFKVEVKSRKRISRDDQGTQSQFVWVELHGGRPKDAGWLFGKADLVAFEREDSFILVKKSDLLTVVNSKVDLVRKVRDPKEAVYKIYTRDGRKDKLTLLPMKDIESIKFDEWKMVSNEIPL